MALVLAFWFPFKTNQNEYSAKSPYDVMFKTSRRIIGNPVWKKSTSKCELDLLLGDALAMRDAMALDSQHPTSCLNLPPSRP